jgi:hypothetical protein
MVVLMRSRTVRQGKPNGLRKGWTVRAKPWTVRSGARSDLPHRDGDSGIFLDMSSSAYHIMARATNPHLLPMY